MNAITLFSIDPELTNDIAVHLLRYIKNQEQDKGIALNEIAP